MVVSNRMSDKFLQEHARIRELAANLIALLNAPEPADVGKLSSAR